MRPVQLLTLMAIVVSIAAIGALAWAQQAGESVTIREALSQDLYAAADDLRVLARIDGDVVAAGRSLVIEAEVTGDVIAAASDVSIAGPVRDDVRAAGRSVRIAAPVDGHVVAAGGTVIIETDRRVGDWAWIAAQRVEIAGSVGSLKAAGETVAILGEVRGDAEVLGEHIEVGPDAVIGGDLVWRSPNETAISESARIVGQIVRKPLPQGTDEQGTAWVGGLVTLLAAILAVTVLHLLFPRFAAEAARTAREEWLRTLGLGLVGLITVPFAAVLLFVTGIGWLLGLMLLVSYVLLLIAGGLFGLYDASALALWLAGRREAITTGMRMGAIAVTVVILVLLSWIPFIGGLISLAVFITGLGSLVLQGYRRWRGAERATA